jgi:ribosomal protein L37AE/L43A
MWCFKEGKSESWKHVSETCDTNFYDASFYIRKIETPEKKQVEMPPVFRQLIPGEIIKEGDMGLNKDDGKFYAITYCIGQSVEGDVIIRKKAEPETPALLPCPFCGGEKFKDAPFNVVVCLDCGSSAYKNTWNLRTTMTGVCLDENIINHSAGDHK